jgi:RNA polymerase sigma-70 factor (ECF subfamily)
MTGATDPSECDPGETAELAHRVRAGDRAAFQQLYDRLAPALYAWTHLRVRPGAGAGVDPQDVLQEVWLRALRGFDGYDPASSFRGWILGIAKNVLLQGYRKSSYDRIHSVPSPDGRRYELMSCPDSVTSIGTRLANDDAIQRFLAYVSGLPREERMLMLYCGLEEYTSAQAAARLGISADAANKRWQSLRSRMRENGTLRALALEGV